MGTVGKNNLAFLKAIEADDVKKARRALVRLSGSVTRNMVKKLKAGGFEMKISTLEALRNARAFNRARMEEIHDKNELY